MLKVISLLLLISIAVPSTVDLSYYDSGRVAYYTNPLGMMRVINVRASWGQVFDLTGYLDGVALNDCEMLGQEVWLQKADGVIVGPFLCVDCAQEAHLLWRETNGLVADVGWWTAKILWGANTYIDDVTIYTIGENNESRRPFETVTQRIR